MTPFKQLDRFLLSSAVVDNQRYPAFVELRGRRYELLIQAAPLESTQPPGPSSP